MESGGFIYEEETGRLKERIIRQVSNGVQKKEFKYECRWRWMRRVRPELCWNASSWNAYLILNIYSIYVEL